MLEFLIGLLLFVFGLGSVDHPALDPQTIADRIEEHISEVLPPQGDPVGSYQGSQEIADNDTEVPEEEQENNQEPQDEDNSQGNEENEENQENSADPDTTQIRAYNTSSGIVIESVAAIAVENAPPLVSCTDNPDCEDQQTPEDDSTPTPTPTVPLPSPIILPIQEPCPPHPITHDNPHVLAPQIICQD